MTKYECEGQLSIFDFIKKGLTIPISKNEYQKMKFLLTIIELSIIITTFYQSPLSPDQSLLQIAVSQNNCL